MTEKAKILFFDIETSHDLVASFGLYPEAIPYQNVVVPWQLISIAWKWAGESKVHSLRAKKGNDKKIAKRFYQEIIKADYVVGHNSDKFDIKRFNTRLILNNLPPLPSKIASIDTLKLARKNFAFTSNRLGYLVSKLDGKEEKGKPESGDWIKFLLGSPKDSQAAAKRIEKYNRQDVVVLERIFDKLKPVIEKKLVLEANTAFECHGCGSDNLIKHGILRLKTKSMQRLHCNNCGSNQTTDLGE